MTTHSSHLSSQSKMHSQLVILAEFSNKWATSIKLPTTLINHATSMNSPICLANTVIRLTANLMRSKLTFLVTSSLWLVLLTILLKWCSQTPKRTWLIWTLASTYLTALVQISAKSSEQFSSSTYQKWTKPQLSNHSCNEFNNKCTQECISVLYKIFYIVTIIKLTLCLIVLY